MTATGLPVPLFTYCKFIINDNIPNKDGELFKLFTNKLNFKISSIDPLIIEKDWPSQEDLTKLVEALNSLPSLNSGNRDLEDSQGETFDLPTTKENIRSGDSEQISSQQAGENKLTKLRGKMCDDASNTNSEAVGTNDVKQESQSWKLTQDCASQSSSLPTGDREANKFSQENSNYCVRNERRSFKVTILHSDITKLEVDCIVNATNKRLPDVGGLARAISLAAGPVLKQECEIFILSGNEIAVTNIFISTGGNLPAKYVMHAEGLKWVAYDDNNKAQCCEDLRRTVIGCLVEADRQGFTSIAFPSIGAAMLKVPKEVCAKCYMEAVKHFSTFNKEQTSLREILFVDVDEDMIKVIKEYFENNWTYPCDPHIVQKDFDLGNKHFYLPTRNVAANIEKSWDTNKLTPSSSSVSTKTSGASKSLVSEDRPPFDITATSTPDKRVEESPVYQIGTFTLHTDSKPAFDHSADITVTVGKPFDKLSGLHDFSVSKNKKKVHELKNIFEVFNVSKLKGEQQKLLCALLPEPDNADTIKEALENLDTFLQSPNHTIFSQNIKKVVLTSSILYKEPDNVQNKKTTKHSYDRKKPGDFARSLYECLNRTSEIANFSITVVGCEEALKSIHNVMESRQVKKIPAEDAGNSVELQTACGICAWKKPIYPVKCCGTLICQDCQQITPKCPFCRVFWRVLIGNQPPGTMNVSSVDDYADGYEHARAYKIEYSFLPGHQNENHKNPGRYYKGIYRTAFVPATKEGLHVLKLLRLAFIRKLIFTIGHSLKMERENAITWNDIHHKTSLHGGTHGYPDSNYLFKVEQELASKGVTFDSASADEIRNIEHFEYCIVNKRSFDEHVPR